MKCKYFSNARGKITKEGFSAFINDASHWTNRLHVAVDREQEEPHRVKLRNESSGKVFAEEQENLSKDKLLKNFIPFFFYSSHSSDSN